MAKNLIFKEEIGPEGVLSVARKMLPILAAKHTFFLLLEGGLGAGKTTLVRNLLKGLGLNPKIPVNSPTFSLIQEYEIEGSLYAHLDLYRISEVSTFDDGLFLEQDRYKGLFVEWGEGHGAIFPEGASHLICLDQNREDRRSYEFYSLI